MIFAIRSGAIAVAASLAVGCASAPKDAGFADVRRAVLEETRQPVEWDPSKPVEPLDDARVAPLMTGELTVDRAVQVAFANNRDVQATLEELGIARGDLLAAGTIRNPIFHAEIRFAGDVANPIEFGLAQTLVDIFHLKNRKRLGRAQFDAARTRVAAAVMHFAGQVRTDYFDLLAARKVLARQDTMMKGQEASTDLARRQHAAGNISDLDLENEQSRYEQAKLDHARAQLEELETRERVISDLGLVQRAELALPADFPSPEPTEPTSAEVEERALARRLDVRIARSEIEAAERGIPIARTLFLEEAELGVHHEREPEGLTTTGPEITGPIPIFDRGAADRTRARAMLRQAQQRLAAISVSARSEARSALERLREARARVDYLRDVVIPRRDRILRLTQLEYNAMLLGVFHLIEARQNLAQAQREHIVAERDYWVARTELDTAILGVGGFSVRPEGAERRRLELFAGPRPPQTSADEGK